MKSHVLEQPLTPLMPMATASGWVGITTTAAVLVGVLGPSLPAAASGQSQGAGRSSNAIQIAQTTSPSALPRPVEPTPVPPLPAPEDLLESSPDPPQLTVPAPVTAPPLPGESTADEVTVTVEEFQVVGSTVFSEAQLQATLAPFLNRPLTLAELLQARTAITQLYVDGGYVASGAFIPPQLPENGVVVIEVLEGTLTDIQIEGAQRLNPNYVRSRLALATQPPVQISRLVTALRLLQLDPLIENISAELSAGLDPGTNRLTVTVAEADSFTVDFVTRNDRSPQVGTWERGLFLHEANLTGRGDGLQLGYLNTEGSDRLLLDYQLPINPSDGTLGIHFEFTDSEVVSEPTDILGIETNSFLVDLTLRQPIVKTPTEELALSLTGSWERSRSEFLEDLLGEAIPFPAFGANRDGEIEIFALRFAQDWVKRGNNQVIAARSQFNLGLGGSTPFDLTGEAPDSQFFSWQGQAQWARQLAPDTLLLLRGETQLASETLPAQELFSLGGQRTVRGYAQDRLLTDSAVMATAEVRIPVAHYRDRQGLIQLVPFFDIGTGWNVRLPNPTPDTLIGAGIGVLWTEGDYWRARVDFGIPLNDEESGDSLQENGIYFSIGLTQF